MRVSRAGSRRSPPCRGRALRVRSARWRPRPCLGVWGRSSRAAHPRAGSGGQASARAPLPGVCRGAPTSRRRAASGDWGSRRWGTAVAPSTAVWCARPRTRRTPRRGSGPRPSGAGPCRADSEASRAGGPASAGRGCLVSWRHGPGGSSRPPRGTCGSDGGWETVTTAALGASHAPLGAGGLTPSCRRSGVNAVVVAPGGPFPGASPRPSPRPPPGRPRAAAASGPGRRGAPGTGGPAVGLPPRQLTGERGRAGPVAAGGVRPQAPVRPHVVGRPARACHGRRSAGPSWHPSRPAPPRRLATGAERGVSSRRRLALAGSTRSSGDVRQPQDARCPSCAWDTPFERSCLSQTAS
jgi:hypothetical protein